MKAVVIFSGGQDSTTCLYWAKKQFGGEIEAITFNYGQNHAIELAQARLICEKDNIKQTVIELPFLSQVSHSAMLTGGDTSKVNPETGLPSSFVPNRNQLFITLAHAYAQKIDAEALVTGVCQTDYSGYPDCRDEFIKAIQYATNLGSKKGIIIYTPLMNLTKAQTFEFAASLGRLYDVLRYSHTCYNGNRTLSHEWGFGCGTCPACKLRSNGWNEYQSMLQHD